MVKVGFRLRVCAGPDIDRELVVRDASAVPVKIGRAADREVDVRLIGRPADAEHDLLCTDGKVSRCHATVDATSRGYVLIDHNSVNGTERNGRFVEPGLPVPLQDGDELRFGPDTVVRFELSRRPAESVEPAPPKVESPPPPPAPPPHAKGEREPTPAKALNPHDTPASRSLGGPHASSRQRPAATPEPPPLPPREHFGKYAIYDSLSESPTDRVDIAVDTQSRTRIALKRFAAKQMTREAKKSVREFAVRGRMWRHPNIAEVLDVGEDAGTLYVASRLVDGLSLAELQTRYAREIDAALSAYIAREICSALHYAQGEVPGFVHRNLSPRTIMMSRAGGVVLVNFGFVPVKVLLDSTVGLSRMEARYLAPEHLGSRGVDPRSDVFSVGVILYELLAQEAIDPRRKAALPDVDTVRPEVPSSLVELTGRAVALHREQRFRSAADMEAALAAALDEIAPGYGPEAVAWIGERLPSVDAR